MLNVVIKPSRESNIFKRVSSWWVKLALIVLNFMEKPLALCA